MAPTLGYWNIRGLAGCIRLVLGYCNEEYEAKLYDAGPGPASREGYKEEWLSVKYKLGLPFPNLPYFIDGDIKLSESKAILRYIGRKHNLLGETDAEKANVDMLLDVWGTEDLKATMVFYNPDCEKMTPEFLKSADTAFQSFDSFGKGKTWFTGDKITIADFALYEYFQRLTAFHAPLVEKYNWIKEFIERFEKLPAVKKCMASDKFIKRPLNNPAAAWGGQ